MSHARRFWILLAVILAGAIGYYFFSTPRTKDIVLVGTVDANQVIVSAKVMGRIEQLNVDEGSHVNRGDLIAVLDTAELQAQQQAAQASLESMR